MSNGLLCGLDRGHAFPETFPLPLRQQLPCAVRLRAPGQFNVKILVIVNVSPWGGSLAVTALRLVRAMLGQGFEIAAVYFRGRRRLPGAQRPGRRQRHTRHCRAAWLRIAAAERRAAAAVLFRGAAPAGAGTDGRLPRGWPGRNPRTDGRLRSRGDLLMAHPQHARASR